jgi:hypothetical protein
MFDVEGRPHARNRRLCVAASARHESHSGEATKLEDAGCLLGSPDERGDAGVGKVGHGALDDGTAGTDEFPRR